MSVRRRKRRLAKRAAALGVGILLALVAAEVAVRVLRIPPFPLAPLDRDSYRLSDNPVLSYEYLPGYEPDPVDSNGFHDGINQAGFRDRDYPLAKPPGTKRIVIFGDSTTAGNGVPGVNYISPSTTITSPHFAGGLGGAQPHQFLMLPTS